MKYAFSLALLYAVVSTLWIFGSDQLVFWLNLSAESTLHLQTAKDWAFVIASSLALFFLLRRLDTEKQLAAQLQTPPRTASMPMALLVLFALLTVLPGLLAYREVLRHFGDTAVSIRLLVWFGFVLLFALIAGSVCILFWWRNTQAHFLLDRLRIDFERANLSNRHETLLRQSWDVVVLLSEEGTIIEVNDRVQEYYGRTPEELRGRPVSELRFASSKEALAEDYRRVAATGGAIFERLHQRRDGTPFPVEVSARAITDQQQRYFQSVVRDISERKRTEAALAAQALRFRATFEQAAVGMAQVAPDGRWLRVNDRFCTMIGYAREELLQKNFQELTHPEDLSKDLWLVEQILSGHIRTYNMEKRYFHHDGSLVWVNLTVSLLRGAEGQPEYFIVVIDDITTRKRTEQRLARISRFYAALNATNEAILHNTRTADELFEQVCRIAVKCGELEGAWIELVDPATQQLRPQAAFGELRSRLVSRDAPGIEGGPLPTEPAQTVVSSGARWVDNDLLNAHSGKPDWQYLVATAGVRACAAFPLKRAGMVIGAFSLYASEPDFFDPELVKLLDQMAADVSFALDNLEHEAQRQRTEQDLRLAAAVYEQSGEGILVSDRHNNVIMVNRAFSEVTGYSLEEMRGRNPRTLSSGRHDRDFYRSMWVTLQETGRWQGKIWNRRKNGEIYPEWLGITALRDAGQRISHYIAIFDDISAHRIQDQEIRYPLGRDPLTGLPDITLLRDRLHQALILATRHQHSVAMLRIDLDQFAAVNQQYGYTAGDRLLEQIGLRLTAMVGETDTVCRLAGDEFAIMLPEPGDPQAAGRLAERILGVLAEPIELDGYRLVSGAGIGISQFPEDSPDGELLLENAARALRWAKDCGPNQIRCFAAGSLPPAATGLC